MKVLLINRLVDVAMIEDGMYVVTPEVDRILHVGYGFSPNRPRGVLPGNTFAERLGNLREIIKSPEKMYECSAMKCYNDYRAFSPKLEVWDGTLVF